MKIFRAIQISLKEFRRPNKLTRLISSQYCDASTGISPCEYKVKNKIKSGKGRASKLSKFMKSIRRFSAPGSLKGTSLKATPHTGSVLNASINRLHCPLLITTRRNSSYEGNKFLVDRQIEFHEIATDEQSSETIINLLEAAQGFTESDGNAVEVCSQVEASIPSSNSTELVSRSSVISPKTLEVLNPKIMSKLIVEEMLRLVSTSPIKPKLIKGDNDARAIAQPSSDSQPVCIEMRTKSYIYFYLNEIIKTLQFLLFACRGRSTNEKGIPNYVPLNGSQGKLGSVNPFLPMSSNNNIHMTPRPTIIRVPCCKYHTIKAIIFPEKFFPYSNSYSFLHTTNNLGKPNRSGDDEWLMQSKRIPFSETGSGDSYREPQNPATRNIKYEEPMNLSAFKPAHKEISQSEFFEEEPGVHHAAVMSNTNSFASSEEQQKSDSASNQTLYSGAPADSASEEETSSANRQEENLTFRSTLNPEFVRPNIASYDMQFEEDSAPHVAMLYSFCAPLPPELTRENIIPIQIVEEEQLVDNKASMSRMNEEPQGLLKSVLDKINILKWN